MARVTTTALRRLKEAGKKVTVLTAYDYSTAKILDAAGVDVLLVGDSLGMVMLGYDSTLPVTMADMLHHTKAVARGTKQALVVADMPFMSYHVSAAESVRNAGQFLQEAGAQAVKLEGGQEMVDTAKAIIRAGIPVMGHLGLTPQQVHQLGGYSVQGRDEAQARKILADAKLLEEAGAFALVLECVPAPLAKLISETINIPTIGIGAGAGCDGQVLVIQDLLGLYSDLTPKFVKRYANLNEPITAAVKAYIQEVREGIFPGPEHTFGMEEELLKKLY
ncbi:MAG: 3-methyl-2-oxobutanoate hydroxymethyltransferase [Carboxydocellales bacterium]